MMASLIPHEELLGAEEPQEEPQTEYERESERRHDARVKKEGESA